MAPRIGSNPTPPAAGGFVDVNKWLGRVVTLLRDPRTFMAYGAATLALGSKALVQHQFPEGITLLVASLFCFAYGAIRFDQESKD